jgi:hypothetical protein
MGRRALKNLKNLGAWAIPTSKRTYIKNLSKDAAGGKENAKNTEVHTVKVAHFGIFNVNGRVFLIQMSKDR